MKWRGRDSVIRQAISCDICGTEMLNANHWFVANDRGPELRICAWSARSRTRTGVRHLCGHKCLHKLVDDFMAKTLNARPPAPVEAGASIETPHDHPAPANDTTLTWGAPHRMQAPPIIGSHVEDFESSAQLIKPREQFARAASASTTLHADAWKRERERQRLAEQTPSRRSIA
jgi:hypothetical protein